MPTSSTVRGSWSLLFACWLLRNDPRAVEGMGVVVSNGCPKACFCNTASKIVYCSRRGLASIPSGISEDSLQLNLNGNRMESPVIRRTNLTGYPRLEHLYLSECSIEAIEVGAFGNLENLKWLDLSGNQIKVIQEQTFQGLNLQHLFLNGNRNIQLLPGSFEGLGTIGLYLHDCSLSRLRPDVITPLNRTIRNLWLNGNELERLDRRFVDIFSRLQHLRLGTNPLQCACEAVWLKEFYDRNSDIFRGSLPPSCLSPRQLKGRYFSELSLYDLRCHTPQFSSIDGFFDTSSGRLRCAATGEPAPVLYWIQPSGKTSKFLPPNDEDITETEAFLALTAAEGDRGHLSGMYICIANNDAGNVTLSLTVPWPTHLSASTVLLAPGPRVRTEMITKSEGLTVHLIQNPPVTGLKGDPFGPSSSATTWAPSAATTGDTDMQSKLLGDSLMLMQRSTPSSWDGASVSKNYTNFNVSVKTVSENDVDKRLFTVGELAWAIVGTHLLTLLICVPLAIICHRRRRSKERKSTRDCKRMDYSNDDVVVYDKTTGNPGHLSDATDQVITESVYLNALRHHRLKYYMDPRPASSDHAMIKR